MQHKTFTCKYHFDVAIFMNFGLYLMWLGHILHCEYVLFDLFCACLDLSEKQIR